MWLAFIRAYMRSKAQAHLSVCGVFGFVSNNTNVQLKGDRRHSRRPVNTMKMKNLKDSESDLGPWAKHFPRHKRVSLQPTVVYMTNIPLSAFIQASAVLDFVVSIFVYFF